MLYDRGGNLRHLIAKQTTQIAQLAVVAARGQKVGHRELQQFGTAHGIDELGHLHLGVPASRRDPAQAKTRGNGLGERRAQHDVAGAIEGFRGQGLGVAEVQVPYMSSSDRGTPRFSSILTRRFLFSSFMVNPRGFCAFGIAITAAIF